MAEATEAAEAGQEAWRDLILDPLNLTSQCERELEALALRDAHSMTSEERRLGLHALSIADTYCRRYDDEMLEAVFAAAGYELVRRRRNPDNGLRRLLRSLGEKLVSMFIVRKPE